MLKLALIKNSNRCKFQNNNFYYKLILILFGVNFYIILKYIIFLNIINILVIILLIHVIHLIFYFASIYQFSKYTSVVKFFWTRVITVFWILELYVFLIVMFLFFISPAELLFFWNPRQFNLDKRLPNISLYNPFLLTGLTVVNINLIIYFQTYKNWFITRVILINFTVLTVYVFLKELENFYYYVLVTYHQKSISLINNKKRYFSFIKFNFNKWWFWE